MNDLSHLIGAKVEIPFGDEHIVVVVRRIDVVFGSGANYALVGIHKGWQVEADASELAPQEDGRPYRVLGDVVVRLSSTQITRNVWVVSLDG